MMYSKRKFNYKILKRISVLILTLTTYTTFSQCSLFNMYQPVLTDTMLDRIKELNQNNKLQERRACK